MNIVREMSGKCQGILKKPVAMNPVEVPAVGFFIFIIGLPCKNIS